MKKIVLFTSSLSQGGAEKVLTSVSLNLPIEYQKTIVVYDDSRVDYEYDGNLVTLKARSSNNILLKFKTFYYRVKEMKDIKKQNNVDVAISFLDSPNFVNLFSKSNEKVIVSVRNFKSVNKKNLYDKIFKLAMKLFYNKADTIVAVSNLIKHDLINNYGILEDKIAVINNPYNVTQIKKMSDEEISEMKQQVFKNPTLINVGRFNKQKGQRHLINIVGVLRKSIPNIQLIFLGEGPMEEELKKQVEVLDLKENIHFWGFKKNPYKYISKADIFVFPSLHEGFPNALVEAMACGTPVISSDCKSGPREILAPGTDVFSQTKESERANYGVLMPVIEENKEELINIWSSEIVKLLNDKRTLKKYSNLGIDRAKEFSIDKTIQQWIEIIE